MPRSRQKKVVLESTGDLPYGKGYCRKCQKIKIESDFYKATDVELDKNGKMSVCKDCIVDLYKTFLKSENGSIQKTILRLCRMLNVKYDESAIQGAIEMLKSKQTDDEKLFGYYRLSLLTINRTNVSDTFVDLTYKDNPTITINTISDDEFEGSGEELKYRWGDNFEKEDYVWLEKEYSDWKTRHVIDTKSQEELLKMIVLKSFDIRKARMEGRDSSALEKAFRELLNTSGLSPLHMNAADSGESKDVFGIWIADIEKEEPAQWLEHEGRPLYKDVDNIEKYFEDYFVRPLRNFILQSKSFNVSDKDVSDSVDINSFLEDGEKDESITESSVPE